MTVHSIEYKFYFLCILRLFACPVKFRKEYLSGAAISSILYKTSANCDFNFLNINAPPTNIIVATNQKYRV